MTPLSNYTPEQLGWLRDRERDLTEQGRILRARLAVLEADVFPTSRSASEAPAR